MLGEEIIKEAEEQAKAIIEKAKAEAEKQIKEKQQALEKQLKERCEEYKKVLEEQKIEAISSARIEAKRMIELARQNYYKRFINALLKKFAESEKLLLSIAKKIKKKEEIYLPRHIKARIKAKKELDSVFGIVYKPKGKSYVVVATIEDLIERESDYLQSLVI